MASQFIELDVSTRFGPVGRRNTETLRKTISELQGLKDIADQVAFGSDWASLEAAFGIPVGSGETYYNLLAAALAAIDVAAVNSYLDRVG